MCLVVLDALGEDEIVGGALVLRSRMAEDNVWYSRTEAMRRDGLLMVLKLVANKVRM